MAMQTATWGVHWTLLTVICCMFARSCGSLLPPGVKGNKIAADPRSNDLTCNNGETLISSSWLYDDTQTCGDIISQVMDPANIHYRQECQRWLGSAQLPVKIKDSYVANSACYQYQNATTRYRAQICCDGTTTDLRCMACSNVDTQYDSPTSRYHTETCDHLGQVVTCTSGQVCEATFVSEYYSSSSYKTRVTKQCADQQACTNSSHPSYCQSYVPRPTCTSCSSDAFGNYNVPVQMRTPSAPCNPNPCLNNGRCYETVNKTESGSNYICDCRYGAWGAHCEFSPCYPNPCQHDGNCEIDDTADFNYTCECRYGAWGDHCEFSPCYPSPCYNGGTCQINDTADSNYTCSCRPGTYGDNCQDTQCTINGDICENGGSCQQSYSDPYFHCVCPIGRTGINCQAEAPDCTYTSNGYCENDGRCYDHGSYGYKCECLVGTIGNRCEMRKQTCLQEELYYQYYYQYYDSSYNCTRRKAIIEGDESLARNYRRNCLTHLGGVYQGDISYGSVKRVPIVTTDPCIAWESVIMYKQTVCCPGCFASPCQNGGWCQPEAASNAQGFTCKCRHGFEGQFCEKRIRVCYASGDPHYKTFDGATISYQGIGRYTLSRTKTAVQHAPSFNVEVENTRRNNNAKVSYTNTVELHTLGQKWKLERKSQRNPVKIQKWDGHRWKEIHTSYSHDGVSVDTNGRFTRLQTNFSLAVETDGRWLTMLKVHGVYNNYLEGLCGTFDGNATTDYVTSAGEDVSGHPNRSTLIGQSWRVIKKSDDVENTVAWQLDHSPRSQPTCSAGDQAKFAGNDYCGLLQDQTGAFSGCLGRIQGTDFYQNCMFDTCANADNDTHAKDAACGSLEVMAAECAQEGFTVDWRTAASCPLACPDGMVYKSRTSACVATCATPNAAQECNLPDTESCVCPDGLVLLESRCIRPEECGCVDNQGRKYQLGEQGRMPDCLRSYQCSNCTNCQYSVGQLQVQITHSGCSNGSVCRASGDQFGCYAAQVNGGWSDWSVWSQCPWPPTCPAGYQVRNRVCNSPTPSAGGDACGSDDTGTNPCTCTGGGKQLIFSAFLLVLTILINISFSN